MKDDVKRRAAHERRLGCDELARVRPRRAARTTYLPLHKGAVWRVEAVANMVVTACGDHIVRIHSKDGKLIHVLALHTEAVYDLCGLDDQVLVSVGGDGRVVTWCSTYGKMIDAVDIDVAVIAVTMLRCDRFVVGTVDGCLIYFSHQHGRCLQIVARTRWAHNDCIEAMAARGGMLCVATHDGTASVWKLGRRIGELAHHGVVFATAVGHRFLATCTATEVRVWETKSCTLVKRFLHYGSTALAFVADLLIVADCAGVLLFVRCDTMTHVASVRTGVRDIRSICVLPDGRIALSCFGGSCALLNLFNFTGLAADLRRATKGAVEMDVTLPRGRAPGIGGAVALLSFVASALFFVKSRR